MVEAFAEALHHRRRVEGVTKPRGPYLPVARQPEAERLGVEHHGRAIGRADGDLPARARFYGNYGTRRHEPPFRSDALFAKRFLLLGHKKSAPFAR